MSAGHHDFVAESAKAAPPAAVMGLTLFGVPVSDVLVVVMIVYTLCQLFFLLRDKWWYPRRSRCDERRGLE